MHEQNIIIKKNIINKYEMGWKINNDENNILISSNDKNNILILSNDENNILISNSEKNNKKIFFFPPYYNLLEKYPVYFPEISNQQNIKCCVSNCIATIYYYLCHKQNNLLKFKISNIYLYNYTKKLINIYYEEYDEDSGTRIIDCLKILHIYGACPDFLYSNKSIIQTSDCDIKKISKYCKLKEFIKINRYEIKKYINADLPIICGIQVFESFHCQESIKTGIIKFPNKNDLLLGGHSIVIIGYNDEKLHYIFINSWGYKWGDDGIGYIPYSYLNHNDYSDEFYVLKKISNPFIRLFYSKISNININEIIMIITILILILLLQIKDN